MAWLSLGCNSINGVAPAFAVVPTGPSEVHLGESLQLTSTQPDAIFTVVGGDAFGTIDPFGLYTAPDVLPEDTTVTIIAQDDGKQTFAFVELIP